MGTMNEAQCACATRRRLQWISALRPNMLLMNMPPSWFAESNFTIPLRDHVYKSVPRAAQSGLEALLIRLNRRVRIGGNRRAFHACALVHRRQKEPARRTGGHVERGPMERVVRDGSRSHVALLPSEIELLGHSHVTATETATAVQIGRTVPRALNYVPVLIAAHETSYYHWYCA